LKPFNEEFLFSLGFLVFSSEVVSEKDGKSYGLLKSLTSHRLVSKILLFIHLDCQRGPWFHTLPKEGSLKKHHITTLNDCVKLVIGLRVCWRSITILTYRFHLSVRLRVQSWITEDVKMW